MKSNQGKGYLPLYDEKTNASLEKVSAALDTYQRRKEILRARIIDLFKERYLPFKHNSAQLITYKAVRFKFTRNTYALLIHNLKKHRDQNFYLDLKAEFKPLSGVSLVRSDKGRFIEMSWGSKKKHHVASIFLTDTLKNCYAAHQYYLQLKKSHSKNYTKKRFGLKKLGKALPNPPKAYGNKALA